MLMPTINQFMSRAPYSVGSTESLARAKTLMRVHTIRHLPVIDGTEVVGVVSDRGVLAVESVPGMDLGHVEVARVMEPPVCVAGDDPVDQVTDLMASQKLDCVVVRGRKGVEGIFTTVDALAALAELARRATA